MSRYKMRRATVAIIAVGVALMSVAVGASPANAQDTRDQLPIVAGTRLQVSNSTFCTVGAVLRSTSIFSNLTSYQRAKRYLLIAKHCAPYKGNIKVGGASIGTVIWTAPDDDLELVEVAPNYQRRLVCRGGSAGPDCSIVETSLPRAFGRVFLSSDGRLRAVPMRAAATPGGDETYCTSGSTTGVNCSWKTVATPPRPLDPGGATAIHSSGYGVLQGDSGGQLLVLTGSFTGLLRRERTVATCHSWDTFPRVER